MNCTGFNISKIHADCASIKNQISAEQKVELFFQLFYDDMEKYLDPSWDKNYLMALMKRYIITRSIGCFILLEDLLEKRFFALFCRFILSFDREVSFGLKHDYDSTFYERVHWVKWERPNGLYPYYSECDDWHIRKITE